MNGPMKFFWKNGRAIPLRMAAGKGYRVGQVAANAGKAGAIGVSAHELHKRSKEKKSFIDYFRPQIKTNKALDAAGLGLSIASGALGAVTFHKGLKGLVGGQLLGHGIDAVGIASVAGSVKGKGRIKDRIKEGARQEARNFLVGNGVFFGGLLAQKKTRTQLAAAAVKLASFTKKALARG